MADLSRVQEKIETLAHKVEDLMSRQSAVSDDGHTQAQVDQLESRLDEILARIP